VTGLEELMWGNVVPTREEQEHPLADVGFEHRPAQPLQDRLAAGPADLVQA
jgi:hypothetical protein